jgi:hypothetical protein
MNGKQTLSAIKTLHPDVKVIAEYVFRAESGKNRRNVRTSRRGVYTYEVYFFQLSKRKPSIREKWSVLLLMST